MGGMALLALTALLILRQQKPEWAPFLRIAATVLALGGILSAMAAVLSVVEGFSDLVGGGVDAETRRILYKALGLALLTEAAASICRDSGETGLAGWVEMAGKLEILLLSLPLVRTVVETVVTLLG